MADGPNPPDLPSARMLPTGSQPPDISEGSSSALGLRVLVALLRAEVVAPNQPNRPRERGSHSLERGRIEEEGDAEQQEERNCCDQRDYVTGLLFADDLPRDDDLLHGLFCR